MEMVIEEYVFVEAAWGHKQWLAFADQIYGFFSNSIASKP